jgi:hypothetical protein
MFEDLLKRKAIRDYLSLFSDTKWKKLIPLTMEFGILNLKERTNVASMSLDNLSMMIHQLKEKFEKKKDKQPKIEKEPPQRESRAITETSNKARSKSKENRPSSKWRKGDSIIFKKKEREISTAKNKSKNIDETNSLNSDIYPKWWGTKIPKMNKQQLIEYSKDDSSNSHIISERRNTTQNEPSIKAFQSRIEETKIEKSFKKKEKKNIEELREIKRKENKVDNEIYVAKKPEKQLKSELKVLSLYLTARKWKARSRAMLKEIGSFITNRSKMRRKTMRIKSLSIHSPEKRRTIQMSKPLLLQIIR